VHEEIIIVEGEPDAIILLQAGYENVVGLTCGARTFKPEWYDLLKDKKKLWLALDCADGEVARLQKRTSIFGIHLDRLAHIIANPTFILALGLHVYLQESSVVNLAAMILIYSAWHWKGGIGRLTTTLQVKSGIKVEKSPKMSHKKADRKIYYYVRMALVCCFGDIEEMLLISAAIVLDHVTGYDIAKWWLYLYTILLLLFVAALILRDRRKASQLDLNEGPA